MSGLIPMDPADYDTRIPPADLACCDHCGGTGAVWDGRDPQTGDVCPVCAGDGVLPEYGVAS